MDVPQVDCIKCGLSVPMMNMKDHIAEAHPGETRPDKVCKYSTICKGCIIKYRWWWSGVNVRRGETTALILGGAGECSYIHQSTKLSNQTFCHCKYVEQYVNLP